MTAGSILLAMDSWLVWRDFSWQSREPRDTHLLAIAGIFIVLAGILFVLSGYHSGFFALHSFALEYLPSGAWANITFMGDAKAALALSTLLVLRHPRLALAILIAALFSTVSVHLLKMGFATLRPPAVLSPALLDVIGPAYKGKSFPSGHTATAFVMAGLLTRLVDYWSGRMLLLTVALLVGCSRIAVGVHWPIDVFVGAAIGLASAWVGLRLADLMKLEPIRFVLITVVLLTSPILLLVDHGGFTATRLTAPLLGGITLLGCGWYLQKIYYEICSIRHIRTTYTSPVDAHSCPFSSDGNC